MGIRQRTRRAVEAAVSADGLEQRLQVVEAMLATLAVDVAVVDTLVRDGRTEARADARAVDALAESVALLTDGVDPRAVVPAEDDALDFSTLTTPLATFLNRALSHDGYMARKGLWFNPPVFVGHVEGDVQAMMATERIVEVPFVLGRAERLAPGSRVLDIGGAQSTVAFSLASRGHHVTVVEPSGYPLAHPNLIVVEDVLEAATLEASSFDMAIVLSAIEHFGTGAYALPTGAARADHAAMAMIAHLLTPGGELVLTVPFGRAQEDHFQRVYDQPGLDALLDGWVTTHAEFARPDGPLTWVPGAPTAGDGDHGVALVAATPSPR